MRHARSLVIAALLLATAGCGQLQQTIQQGQNVATQAAELKQTADVLAPTLQALAPTLQAQAGAFKQTAEALAPTLQALAPTLQAAAPTAEALLPTLQALVPTLEASGYQQTAEALVGDLPQQTGDARQTAIVMATARVGEGPSDIPRLPDGTNLLVTGTRLLYLTPNTLARVREFYRTQMPEFGWSEVPGALEVGKVGRLQFVRPGQTATITFGASGERSVVDITVEPTAP